MKPGLIRLLAFLALFVPALPYFMPIKSAVWIFVLVNFFWFLICFFLILIWAGYLGFLMVKAVMSGRGEERFKEIKLMVVRILQIGMLFILSLTVYVQIDNWIEFFQIRKVERIFKVNDLYAKEFNQLPNKLKKYNSDTKWFSLNYSSVRSKNKQIEWSVFYNRDLLIEWWDCSLYYTKEGPPSERHRFYRKGEGGYSWYKFCLY